MKPEKLNSILKNLRKGEVYKEYKDVPKNNQDRANKKNWPLKKEWVPVNPRVLERIKKQLVTAHYVNNDKELASQHRRILEKLTSKKEVDDYLDSDDLKTRRIS